MYEMRVSVQSVQERPFWCTEGVFGGSVSTSGGYFATDFREGPQEKITRSPFAENLPPPLPEERVSSGTAAKKTDRPGFLRSGCASAGLRGGPGGLAVPGKPSRVRGILAVPGKPSRMRGILAAPENPSRMRGTTAAPKPASAFGGGRMPGGGRIPAAEVDSRRVREFARFWIFV